MRSDGAEPKLQSGLDRPDRVLQRCGRDGLELREFFYKGWVGWDLPF